MLRSTFFITTVFVFLAAVSRLLPHPANFTPILAISLFAGAYISHRGIALLIPILAMLVSDFFLGFHDLMLPIYALIIGFSLVGRFGLSDNRTALRVGGYSLGGSVVFFLATNFLVWLTSGMYAMNGAGLVQCYTMAIPFFQNQVLGDLFFSAVLFGSMEFLISRNLVLAKVEVRIEESWKKLLQEEFDRDYFLQLRNFVKAEYRRTTVYPPAKYIFRAFDVLPFHDVKVVILGQDPYHGEQQANGLCFSVGPGIPIPPSLRNIYKEIRAELGGEIPKSGDLSGWAEQGVLLLNATLTVEAHKAGSHQNKGWETFTDSVIQKLSDHREGLVFMLWGSYAQKKGEVINRKKHLVLTSPHPSPLSASRGFFGNGHFQRTNDYLIQNNKKPINWFL